MLGETVTVNIDSPMGTYHPKQKDNYYPEKYGYIEGIMGGDGEEQDAYVLGVDHPVETFDGVVIAIVYRLDDIEDKWVVAPKGLKFTREVVEEQVHFQEQFFQTEIEIYQEELSS